MFMGILMFHSRQVQTQESTITSNSHNTELEISHFKCLKHFPKEDMGEVVCGHLPNLLKSMYHGHRDTRILKNRNTDTAGWRQTRHMYLHLFINIFFNFFPS